MQEVTLSPESVKALAQQLFELMRTKPEVSDPWLGREDAAAYLNISPRSFDRIRDAHVETLRPASEHPLRWSRNALDTFKMSRGAPARRAGRRPSVFTPPLPALTG
jgi:hypothetical protein